MATLSNYVYKFNKDSKATLENIKESKLYQLREKLCNNTPLTDSEEDFLIEKYNTDSCKVLGYFIDFSDVMKKFYIETEYGYSLISAIDTDSAIRYFSEWRCNENTCFDVFELNFVTTAVK